jgi:hypothetical protein
MILRKSNILVEFEVGPVEAFCGKAAAPTAMAMLNRLKIMIEVVYTSIENPTYFL